MNSHFVQSGRFPVVAMSFFAIIHKVGYYVRNSMVHIYERNIASVLFEKLCQRNNKVEQH